MVYCLVCKDFGVVIPHKLSATLVKKDLPAGPKANNNTPLTLVKIT